jgi:GAF domain-containing protein
MNESIQRICDNRHLDLQALVDMVVEEAIRITGSSLGYLAVLSEDESQLTMLAWSKSAMDICRTTKVPIQYPVEATGLWGDCIRERGAVVVNDYENCTRPTRKGYPDGHVPVKRHMNVPMRSGTRMTGILGVGNKVSPYIAEDAIRLQAFADAVWPVLAAAKKE